MRRLSEIVRNLIADSGGPLYGVDSFVLDGLEVACAQAEVEERCVEELILAAEDNLMPVDRMSFDSRDERVRKAIRTLKSAREGRKG